MFPTVCWIKPRADIVEASSGDLHHEDGVSKMIFKIAIFVTLLAATLGAQSSDFNAVVEIERAQVTNMCSGNEFMSTFTKCSCTVDALTAERRKEGGEITQGARQPRFMKPTLDELLLKVNVSSCLTPDKIKPYAYKRSKDSSSTVKPPELREAVAQCVSDDLPSQFAKRPLISAKYVDGLFMNSLVSCNAKLKGTISAQALPSNQNMAPIEKSRLPPRRDRQGRAYAVIAHYYCTSDTLGKDRLFFSAPFDATENKSNEFTAFLKEKYGYVVGEGGAPCYGNHADKEAAKVAMEAQIKGSRHPAVLMTGWTPDGVDSSEISERPSNIPVSQEPRLRRVPPGGSFADDIKKTADANASNSREIQAATHEKTLERLNEARLKRCATSTARRYSDTSSDDYRKAYSACVARATATGSKP